MRSQQRGCESENNRTHVGCEAAADIGERQPLSSAEEGCSQPLHQPARRDEREKGSVKCRSADTPRPRQNSITGVYSAVASLYD